MNELSTTLRYETKHYHLTIRVHNGNIFAYIYCKKKAEDDAITCKSTRMLCGYLSGVIDGRVLARAREDVKAIL